MLRWRLLHVSVRAPTKYFPIKESPPAQPWLFEEKQRTNFNLKNSALANQTKLTAPNITGSLTCSPSFPPSPSPLCLHSAGRGIWKCLARLCAHWELSDNSHFKLFWYRLCGELPFPWEHDLPLGSGACCTARRINRARGEGGKAKKEGVMGREREHSQRGYLQKKQVKGEKEKLKDFEDECDVIRRLIEKSI